MITADELQNNLMLIENHINDALEALITGEDDIIEANLRDIRDTASELRSYLPERCSAISEDVESIGNIADGVDEL